MCVTFMEPENHSECNFHCEIRDFCQFLPHDFMIFSGVGPKTCFIVYIKLVFQSDRTSLLRFFSNLELSALRI